MSLLGETKVIIKGKRRQPTPVKTSELDRDMFVLSFDFAKQEAVFVKLKTVNIVRERTCGVKIKTVKGDVKLSGDNQVMTQRGWLSAGDVNVNDTLYTFVDMLSGQFLKTISPERDKQIIEKYCRCVEPVGVLEVKETTEEESCGLEMANNNNNLGCFFTDMILVSK